MFYIDNLLKLYVYNYKVLNGSLPGLGIGSIDTYVQSFGNLSVVQMLFIIFNSVSRELSENV